MKKKLYIILGSIGLLLIVMAYASDINWRKSDDVELSFVWWGGEERHEKTLEVIDLYNETHDGVTIEPQYYSYDGLNEKFPLLLIGGIEPDIMQVNYAWVYKFAGKTGEGFYDLYELADEIGLENWDEDELDVFAINDHLEAVPYSFTARIYGYNTEVLEEAGIEPPKTWEEVFSANDELRAKMGDDYYLLGDAANEKSLMYIMITYLNQELDKEFIVDGKLNYTAEDLEIGFEFLQTLIDEHVIPNIADDSREFDAENPRFIDGHYAGISEWSSSLGKYAGNLPEGNELELGDFITSSDQAKVMLKPSMGFAISKNTDHPKEAAEFINWLFTDEEAIKIMGTERGVSSNQVTHEILEENEMLTDRDLEVEAKIEAADTIYLSPYYEEANVADAYTTALDKFLYGKSSAKEAASEMQQRVEEALELVVGE